MATPLWANTVINTPTDWFYPSVFMRGELNGLQGIPGHGKTWLMCELAAQTSIGGAVQGVNSEDERVSLPCGNVLFLSGEDTPAQLNNRIVSCGGDLSKIAYATEGTRPQIGTHEMADLFGVVHPVLCVIDTLPQFSGAASINDINVITTTLEPLQALARRYNTAVVVIMHVTKHAARGNGGDSTSFAIGSYALAGSYRALWTLGQIKDDDGNPTTLRALCLSKNNYVEQTPPAILFELHNGFHWAGVSTKYNAEGLYKKNRGRMPVKANEIITVIERLLADGKPMPSVELEAAVKDVICCHHNTVEKAKHEMNVLSFQSGRQWLSVLPSQSTIH